MGQTDLMSVGANPLQNTRIPSALTALLAAVTIDIRPGTLPVESGCTDWIRVLRTSSGKVACEEVARLCCIRQEGRAWRQYNDVNSLQLHQAENVKFDI